MKKMILGCFLYGTAIGLYAQAPQGDFKGSIQIGQTTMPIVFHFGQQNGQPATTMDSLAQGVFGFPVQSSECLSDGELTLKIPQIQFCYVGKVRGDSLIEGTVTQAGQSLPLNLVRTARKAGASSEPERPGTPKPPLPYREEEVSVTTKDGIKLSGSLTLPKGKGPFPAVLLISGSGPQDRNEEAWKYKPFLMIADCLTRQGSPYSAWTTAGPASREAAMPMPPCNSPPRMRNAPWIIFSDGKTSGAERPDWPGTAWAAPSLSASPRNVRKTWLSYFHWPEPPFREKT